MSQSPGEPEKRKNKTLVWDCSVNPDKISLNSYFTVATQYAKTSTIRTHFLKRGSGRHILNIKVIKLGHVGIGLVNKAFKIDSDWVGGNKNSYGTWDNVIGYYSGAELKLPNGKKLVEKDIVTVDLDMNELSFSWAVNGTYFGSDGPDATLAPTDWAFAASVWNTNDCVEIFVVFFNFVCMFENAIVTGSISKYVHMLTKTFGRLMLYFVKSDLGILIYNPSDPGDRRTSKKKKKRNFNAKQSISSENWFEKKKGFVNNKNK
ncbi:hypothetical protein RFI_00279 [Reticulomyxa filosa]|uniref:B30.2/SPRY domain-containing protein n=1 Tax=Reticulomyxa filosa TaxID=46433 RepID=X6PF97_RETFI|nr:hypothetical protein RFI_00279 [Reticulomyxa filosa]|eukprot:ETO36783.1 hypothetical protein RFI_00279 [Reticulomyxa filosa]